MVSEVQSMVGQIYCSRPEVRQNIMAKGHGREKLLRSWHLEKREVRMSQREKM